MILSRSSPKDIKRNQLSQEYALMQAKQEVAYQAYLETASTDPIRSLEYKKQAEKLLQNLQMLDEELQKLDEVSSNPNQRCIAKIDKDLSKIDFAKAKKIFKKRILNFGHNGGSAGFLLQQNFAMLGELYLLDIRNLLALGNMDYPSTLKHYPIGLNDNSGLPLDRLGLLQRLAKYLCVDIMNDITQLVARVHEVIFGLMRSNTTVCIEINGWDEIPVNQQESVLSWFLEAVLKVDRGIKLG